MSNYKRVFIDGYSYYITVVTYKRNPILIENIDLLRESFKISKKKYPYKIEAIVILPDHFHMIITPKNAKDYPNIIKVIKQHFSKHCPAKYYKNIKQSASRLKEGYSPIWQKRYYAHTIRNKDDFDTKVNYIHSNPIKHNYVNDVSLWEYSSFNKFN